MLNCFRTLKFDVPWEFKRNCSLCHEFHSNEIVHTYYIEGFLCKVLLRERNIQKQQKTLSFPLMFNELEIKLGKQYPRCIKFDLNRSNNIFPYLELIHNLFLHTACSSWVARSTTKTDANNGQLDRHILWEFGPCRMLLKRQPRGARCFGIWWFHL